MMNNHLEKFIDKQKVSFVTSVDEEGFCYFYYTN